MTKLDKAINRLIQRARQSDDLIEAVLVHALEEIRDQLTTHDSQINSLVQGQHLLSHEAFPEERETPPYEEQPTTFLPWHDVVEIVGPTSISMATDSCFIGFEGVVTDTYGDDEYRVQIAEAEDWFLFPASSLKLVYRLKPRKQVEPTFKAGEYVKDMPTDYTYQIMADVMQPQTHAQLRDPKDGQPVALSLDRLVKIDKPAPFQVGDWIYNQTYGHTFQVTQIEDNWLYGDVDGKRFASYINRSTKVDPPKQAFKVGDWVRDERGYGGPVKVNNMDDTFVWGTDEQGQEHSFGKRFAVKIPAPAPRFTFGDRVRVDNGDLVFRFVRADCDYTRADIYGEDSNLMHNIPISCLSLDTGAD